MTISESHETVSGLEHNPVYTRTHAALLTHAQAVLFIYAHCTYANSNWSRAFAHYPMQMHMCQHEQMCLDVIRDLRMQCKQSQQACTYKQSQPVQRYRERVPSNLSFCTGIFTIATLTISVVVVPSLLTLLVHHTSMMCMCNIRPVAFVFINRACMMCIDKWDMQRVPVLTKPVICAGVNETYCAYF